jgi:YVTN family beta-propeller protein
MSSTQLTYSFNTTPGPLTAGLTDAIITFTARNATSSQVSLQGISIQIQIGAAADDLTNTPAQINVLVPAGWQQDKANQTGGSYTFVFTPVSAPVQVNPNESLVFTFSNIQLNNAAGASAITITEGSEGTPTQVLSVSVFPGGWGSIVFTASPTYLSEEGNVTLSWNGPSSATYQLQYTNLATGSTTPIAASIGNYGTYPGEGQPALTIAETTLFTLTVTAVVDGTTVTATPQVIVPVAEQLPVINSFTGNLIIVNGGLTLQLNWTTTNAINVEGSWTDNLLDANPSQPVSIRPPFSEQYEITAVGQNGYTSSAVVLMKQWQDITSIPLGIDTSSIAATSPDGTMLLVGGNSGNIACVNLTNLSATPQIVQVCTSTICSITFDPDSEHAYITNNSSTVYVLAIKNLNAPIQTINCNIGDIDDVTVAPNNSVIVACGDTGLAICNPSNLSLECTVNLQLTPLQAAITPDSSHLVVTTCNSNLQPDANSYNYTLSIIDLTNPTAIPQTVNLGTYTIGEAPLTLSPDGHYANVMLDTYILMVNLQNLNAGINFIPVGNIPLTMEYTASGKHAITSNPFAGSVSVIDMTSLQLIKNIIVGKTPEATYFSADEKYAFVFLADGNNIAVLDLSNFSLKQTIQFSQQVYNLVYGNGMAIAIMADSSIHIIATAFVPPLSNTWAKVTTVAAPNAAPLSICATYDNSQIIMLQQGGNMVLININNLTATPVNSPSTANTTSLCIQPAYMGFYTGDSVANTITNYQTDGMAFSKYQSYPLNFGPTAIAASADGNLLAAISDVVTNTVAIINLNNNNSVQYVNLDSSPNVLAISPNSRYVITGNQPETGPNSITVIDTNPQGLPPQTFTFGNTSGVIGLAISPNNEYALATAYNQVGALSLTQLGTPPATIQVGNASILVSITPSGQHAYTTNVDDGTLSVIDLSNLSTTLQTINLGNEPEYICFTPDGKFAFVSLTGNNTLAILNLQSPNNAPQIIQLSAWAQFIIASYDSRYVFTANSDGTVDVFSRIAG